MSCPNQEQAAVLSQLHGTLLVLAPAGTGKTRIMADRLAAVIATGMSPQNTLDVTFTNRAAEHMRAGLSEYEVIRLLASEATGIAFFGDLDQTIYEWRGSKPDEVIQRVKADFGPVTELSLRDNYRATKALLRVTDRHASTFAHRRTQTRPAPSLPDGWPPESHHAENSASEAHWIATRIRDNPATNVLGRIGILTRTHKRSEAVSRALTQQGIDHLTVEQFDFFRRQEIKDLLARLRLLLNPSDSGSLQRLTLRPASGIGPATLRTLWLEGQQCGLKITDLAQLRTHQHGISLKARPLINRKPITPRMRTCEKKSEPFPESCLHPFRFSENPRPEPSPNLHGFTAMTLTAELNQKAKAILIRELGPVGYARFIQQYEEGSGNYTEDRHDWLGEESAASLHGQAFQLAATGELPRPTGAKLLTPKNQVLAFDFQNSADETMLVLVSRDWYPFDDGH